MSDHSPKEPLEDIEANVPPADREDEHAEAIDEVMEDGAVAPPPSRDDEMDQLRRTAAEADKRVLQAQAEAENFRKRMRRDYEDQLKFAALPMVADLLQVRDNLHRAIEAARSGAEGDVETGGLVDGVSMVAKQFDDTLAKFGVKEIPAEGELFDPNVHEAVSQIPSPDHAEGTVAHVAAAGFQMHDRVVRPAQVVVSRGG